MAIDLNMVIIARNVAIKLEETMTNGNDYLEIEQDCWEQIETDYIEAIKKGEEEIPEAFKLQWIDCYREGE